MARKESAGRRAIRLEAMSKQAKGKPHHTRLANRPNAKVDLTNEYEAEVPQKPKKAKKAKKSGKANVPNAY